MLLLLGYIWAFPITLIGFLIAFSTGTTTIVLSTPVMRATLVIANKGGLCWRWMQYIGAGGGAIGSVCFFVDESQFADATTRAHELHHVKQIYLWGVFYTLGYVGNGLWQVLRGRAFYRDNWFEARAREAALRQTGARA